MKKDHPPPIPVIGLDAPMTVALVLRLREVDRARRARAARKTAARMDDERRNLLLGRSGR